MIPGWNYCQYYILKEALSFTFELLTLHGEALVQYDELEASFFQTLEEQGAPWFKKFGATEEGDDNPDIFRLNKPYRERIIQNSISIYDFRMYLFSRQCTLLNILKNPVEICLRAKSFVSSFSRTLKDYRESLPPLFREIWTYSIVLNLLRFSDELLAICNLPSATIILYENVKGELLLCARYQLDRLGVSAKLLSHSFHCGFQTAEADITTPDESRIKTSNDALIGVLRSKTEFDSAYEVFELLMAGIDP